MPISKAKWMLYPANWTELSESVRRRAGGKCEVCDHAGGEWGYRTADKVWHPVDRARLAHRGAPPFMLAIAPGKLVKVVEVKLTVAHRDCDPSNNAPDNLACWCDYCHLTHDGARANKLRHAEAVKRRAEYRATLAAGDLFDARPPSKAAKRRRRQATSSGKARRGGRRTVSTSGTEGASAPL